MIVYLAGQGLPCQESFHLLIYVCAHDETRPFYNKKFTSKDEIFSLHLRRESRRRFFSLFTAKLCECRGVFLTILLKRSEKTCLLCVGYEPIQDGGFFLEQFFSWFTHFFNSFSCNAFLLCHCSGVTQRWSCVILNLTFI